MSSDQDTRRSCFLIGPIGSDGSDVRVAADWLLYNIVKPVMTELSFDVKRADEIPDPGMIDSQVINSIVDADLVIADLSGHNPNAFYELAIRHMVQKPIVHMVDTKTDIPFDVRPFRAIVFSTHSFQDQEKARNDLRRQASEAIKPDHAIDNPVTRARGRLELEQSATPKERLLTEAIDSLTARLRRLERGSWSNSNNLRHSRIHKESYSDNEIIITHDGADETGERIINAISLSSFWNHVDIFVDDDVNNRIRIVLNDPIDYNNFKKFEKIVHNIDGVSDVYYIPF